jgi:heterotetrameric sarcosine oxidase gamma subunit
MPTSTRKGRGPVADLLLTDESATPKWRVFEWHDEVRPGLSDSSTGALVWSVSPGEWTALGDRPEGETVDLTDVRAMFRLTGERAADLINRICGLDLTDGMFPDGAAARTLLAGVATEIVRDDQGDDPSYLILPSRSFGVYLRDVIEDAGAEFGLESAEG